MEHESAAGAPRPLIIWFNGGPSFAYSLTVHLFHTRRDRVASLTTYRLHGAAIQKSLTTRATEAEP